MKDLFLDLLKGLLMGICFVVFCLILATANHSAYANGVRPHGELVLADYLNKGAYSPIRAFFMRNISMRPHVMVKLERDTFECAGFLYCLSANPVQLCHPYLAVNGKAPLNKGAH